MGKMRLPEEFKEFINLLNSHDVKYVHKEDLVANKKSTNRLIDRSDAEVIESIKINPNINTENTLKLRLILSNKTIYSM